MITIEHEGGATKLVELDCFDAPRAWVRLRYPTGAGVFAFSLVHGGIEAKRGELPLWRICDADLATLREQAKELKIKFKAAPFQKQRKNKPRAPKKKTEQKQRELFE